MDETAVERLTDRELQALRLVFSHPSLGQIAREMTLSRSRVQQILASASAKLGARDRWEAARKLAEIDSQPIRLADRTDANDQIGEGTKVTLHPVTGPVVQLIEAVAQFLGRQGESNELTPRQRLNRTIMVALITLVVLSILAASMGALGSFGVGLASRGIHHV